MWMQTAASSCAPGRWSAIRYYDTSAVLPLYLNEPASAAAQRALAQDSGQLVTSVLTPVELRSGLARLEFEGVLTPVQVTTVFERARQDLERTPRRLDLSQDVLEEAVRLLRSHKDAPVRTLDLLHVATCLRYGTGGFVTNDKQQARFAQRAGLRVLYLEGELEP